MDVKGMFKIDASKGGLDSGKTGGDPEEGSLESRVNVGLGRLRAVSVCCIAAEEGKKNLVV